MRPDDDPLAPPPPKPGAFVPRALANLSVGELTEYIAELEGEIARVKADISRKQAARAGADSVFKR